MGCLEGVAEEGFKDAEDALSGVLESLSCLETLLIFFGLIIGYLHFLEDYTPEFLQELLLDYELEVEFR